MPSGSRPHHSRRRGASQTTNAHIPLSRVSASGPSVSHAARNTSASPSPRNTRPAPRSSSRIASALYSSPLKASHRPRRPGIGCARRASGCGWRGGGRRARSTSARPRHPGQRRQWRRGIGRRSSAQAAARPVAQSPARTLRRRDRGAASASVMPASRAGSTPSPVQSTTARCRTSAGPLASPSRLSHASQAAVRTATPYRRSMSAQRGAGGPASSASRRTAATSASGAFRATRPCRRPRTSSNTGRSVVTSAHPIAAASAAATPNPSWRES